MAFRIIGDQDTVLGFRFAGIHGDAVDGAESALAAFRRATADPGGRILILTEPVAEWIESAVTEHRFASRPPYIVVVADIWGTKVASKTLEDLIYEAVGIRIVT